MLKGTRIAYLDTWTTQYVPHLLDEPRARNLGQLGNIDEMSNKAFEGPTPAKKWETFMSMFLGSQNSIPSIYSDNFINAFISVDGLYIDNINFAPFFFLTDPYGLEAAFLVKQFFLNGPDLLRYHFGFYMADFQKWRDINAGNPDPSFGPDGAPSPGTWVNTNINMTSEDVLAETDNIAPFGWFEYIGSNEDEVDTSSFIWGDVREVFGDPAFNGPTKLEAFKIRTADNLLAKRSQTRAPWYYSQLNLTAHPDLLNAFFSSYYDTDPGSATTTGADPNELNFLPLQGLFTPPNESSLGAPDDPEDPTGEGDFKQASMCWMFNNIITAPPFTTQLMGFDNTGWDWQSSLGADTSIAPAQANIFFRKQNNVDDDPYNLYSTIQGFEGQAFIPPGIGDDWKNLADLMRRHGNLSGLKKSPAYAYVSPQKLFINGGLYKGLFAPVGKGFVRLPKPGGSGDGAIPVPEEDPAASEVFNKINILLGEEGANVDIDPANIQDPMDWDIENLRKSDQDLANVPKSPSIYRTFSTEETSPLQYANDSAWRHTDHYFEHYLPFNGAEEAAAAKEKYLAHFQQDNSSQVPDTSFKTKYWKHKAIYSYTYTPYEETISIVAGSTPSGYDIELFLPNFHALLEESRTILNAADYNSGGEEQLANRDAYIHSTLNYRLGHNHLRPILQLGGQIDFDPSKANMGSWDGDQSLIPSEFGSYGAPDWAGDNFNIGEMPSWKKVPYLFEWQKVFRENYQNIFADEEMLKSTLDYKEVILMPKVMKRYKEIGYSFKHIMPHYVQFEFGSFNNSNTKTKSISENTPEIRMSDILNETGFMPLVIAFYKYYKKTEIQPEYNETLAGSWRGQIQMSSRDPKFRWPLARYNSINGIEDWGKKRTAEFHTIFNLDNFFKFWMGDQGFLPVKVGSGDADDLFEALKEMDFPNDNGGDFGTETIAPFIGDLYNMQIIDVRPEEEWDTSAIWKEILQLSENVGTGTNELITHVYNLVEEKLRSYKEMISGRPAYSELLFFEIEKYRGDIQGLDEDQIKQNLVQTFYIPNSNEFDEDGVMHFIDSQVVFGQPYTYVIKEIKYVMGSLYQYASRMITPGFSADAGTNPFGQKDNLDDVSKYTLGLLEYDEGNANPGDVTFKQEGITAIGTAPDNQSGLTAVKVKKNLQAECLTTVRTQPSHKMLPLPFATAKAIIKELPPTPPRVDIIPYQEKADRLYIAFQATTDDFYAVPVGLTEEENNVSTQIAKYDDYGIEGPANLENPDELDVPTDQLEQIGDIPKAVHYKSEGDIFAFESYRISEEDRPFGPISYLDFGDETISQKTTLSFKERTTFIDTLKPNVNYYYIFRSIDTPRSGLIGNILRRNWSNPTNVHRVKLVKNRDTVYLDMEVQPLRYFMVQAKINDKVPSKPFKKYLMLKPSLEQSILNTDDQAGGINYWSNDIYPSIKEWVFGAIGADAAMIPLGTTNKTIFGTAKNSSGAGQNKNVGKFKLRLTSKRTGRRVDIMIGCPTPKLYDGLNEVLSNTQFMFDTSTEDISATTAAILSAITIEDD